MGAAMSQRLREHGFDVVGWDMNADRNKGLGGQRAADRRQSPRRGGRLPK